MEGYCSFFLIISISAGLYLYFSNHQPLPTYFNYSKNDIQTLGELNTEEEISTVELSTWDDITFNLVKTNKLGDAPASKIYAYLYLAQHEAGYLSYNVKHKFSGSIGPISAKVLCLFLPNACQSLERQSNSDPYSKKLADIVINKIILRLQLEKKNISLYPEKVGKQYWQGTRPYFGQDVGTWKPWFINTSSEFRVSTPPPYDDIQWKKELDVTKDALMKITPRQKQLVVFWAGNPGTITPPGLWLTLANNYMESINLPLEKRLLIRAVLAMGIADSVIAVFDSKYAYWIKRPNMIDTSIQTIMPTPNHPSYPAGHASISAAAATILTYYFPQMSSTWEIEANEAAYSRVWGGIHFTIDTKKGYELGQNVGNAAIKRSKKHFDE